MSFLLSLIEKKEARFTLGYNGLSRKTVFLVEKSNGHSLLLSERKSDILDLFLHVHV